MPKKIDPAVKERALRMVSEHRGEYSSLTACCDQVGRRLGLGKETVRRWAVVCRPTSTPEPGPGSALSLRGCGEVFRAQVEAS
ncbi:hypothetical protein [Dietzia sp. E1]|uniref:hypothetical protein n=1 Tax=Dietzia sp. E1 TaxID=328361 RepID=UPI0001F645E3|nr:hypothetical protein [Dietzia sp. E1]EFV90847.1 transposase IS3/IS911 family protein [Dietzia cinnamea P4]